MDVLFANRLIGKVVHATAKFEIYRLPVSSARFDQ